MKKFKTVAACLKQLGITLQPDVSSFPEADRAYTLNNWMLTKVIEAHIQANNPGWVADFSDGSQEKHYNYFWVKKDATNSSGFGFSGSVAYCGSTNANVGARFCFPTREMAIWVRDNFTQLYLDVQLIPIKK